MGMFFRSAVTTAVVFGLTAAPTLAQGFSGGRPPFADRPGGRPGHVASVPEIDASTGLLALAAVAAALLFVWERRRRAS